MKTRTILTLLAAAAGLCLASCKQSEAQTTLIPGTASENAAVIPDDYLGLSYESKMLVPNEEGTYYFDTDNQALLNILKTLGIRNIRIGGSSTDNPNDPLPTLEDVDKFFQFAREAGVRVIYSVRLRDGDPEYARGVARLIQNKYSDRIDYMAIGNEPGYYKDYDGLLKPHWAPIQQAINEVFPGVRFCAPDDNPNPPLCNYMLDNFEIGRASCRERVSVGV